MAESVRLLMLEFLGWVANRPRTYADVMEAWQTTCPRHTIWEDAIIDGLVEIGESRVSLTPRGKTLLAEGAPSVSTRSPAGA